MKVAHNPSTLHCCFSCLSTAPVHAHRIGACSQTSSSSKDIKAHAVANMPNKTLWHACRCCCSCWCCLLLQSAACLTASLHANVPHLLLSGPAARSGNCHNLLLLLQLAAAICCRAHSLTACNCASPANLCITTAAPLPASKCCCCCCCCCCSLQPASTAAVPHLPLSGPAACRGNCHPGASRNAANKYSSSALSVGSSADQGLPACSPPPFQLKAFTQLPCARCRTRVAM
jgi:hypothetical protein